jgi:hypothetical protein
MSKGMSDSNLANAEVLSSDFGRQHFQAQSKNPNQQKVTS